MNEDVIILLISIFLNNYYVFEFIFEFTNKERKKIRIRRNIENK